jgi:glycosyltransferase involved in cell wall biosynthesis
MRILFVHQNFPGQYRHLAASLAAEHEVVGLGDAANLRGRPPLAGVRRVGYDFATADRGAAPWRPLRPLDAALRRAVVVARAAESLKSEGFVPDLVCVHPGWGEGILLRDVWPDARTIGYFEFFYRPSGSDVGFDPEFSRGGVDVSLIVRGRNAALLLGMAACDAGVSPTHWQHRQLPDAFQRRCEVIHDGIDCTAVRPDPAAAIRLKRERLRLTRADEVVTYAVRNLEPYRGFHVFMRALPELLRRRPRAHVLIVGGNETSYSPRPAGARTWKATLMAEVGARLDISRIHFLGRLPHADYLRVLQVSSAHVYLTYPFVLSWSCLEAMAAACPIVASRTPPVEEVIDDGQHGLLVDFFDQEALLAAIERQLDRRDEARAMGERARQRVLERFDLTTVCLPQQRRLLLDACNGRGP